MAPSPVTLITAQLSSGGWAGRWGPRRVLNQCPGETKRSSLPFPTERAACIIAGSGVFAPPKIWLHRGNGRVFWVTEFGVLLLTSSVLSGNVWTPVSPSSWIR